MTGTKCVPESFKKLLFRQKIMIHEDACHVAEKNRVKKKLTLDEVMC